MQNIRKIKLELTKESGGYRHTDKTKELLDIINIFKQWYSTLEGKDRYYLASEKNEVLRYFKSIIDILKDTSDRSRY